MKSRNVCVLSIILVLLILLSSCGTGSQKAYDFKVRKLDVENRALSEDMIRLRDFQDVAIVLNFWASWCPPCGAEMPGLVAAHDIFKNKGVQFIGINVWSGGENAGDASDFLKEFSVTYPSGADTTGEAYTNYARQASLGSLSSPLPMTVFIDRNGYIIKIWPGSIQEDKLVTLVNELVAS